MGKLFSGNADFIAVVIVVVTLGLSTAVKLELRAGSEAGGRVFRQVPARILTRVPARLERIPARLRMAALEHREHVLDKIACKR